MENLETVTPATLDAHLSVLVDSEPDLGTISHLNHEGDTTYTWDRKNKAECEAAQAHFEALKAKGFLVFKVNRLGGKQKKPTTGEFDPKAGKYIYTAPEDAPEMATEFDPQANYVATPAMQGG